MRNGAQTVEAAVRSIIWQSYANWEFMIIDDGSTDDGSRRVMQFGDPRIHVVRHDTSLGLPARLNEAIDLARGEYIARMDADDISYPERLAVQVSQLRSDPRVDVVAAQAVLFRREGEIVGLLKVPTTHAEIVRDPYRGFSFPHPTWCGKAGWFRRNRYDSTARTAQDWELLLRAAASSRFAASDKVLLGYRKEFVRRGRSFAGRMVFANAIWRDSAKSGAYLKGAGHITMHFVRFALETVAGALGAEEWWLRQKLPSVPADEAARWNEVLKAIKSLVTNGGSAAASAS